MIELDNSCKGFTGNTLIIIFGLIYDRRRLWLPSFEEAFDVDLITGVQLLPRIVL